MTSLIKKTAALAAFSLVPVGMAMAQVPAPDAAVATPLVDLLVVISAVGGALLTAFVLIKSWKVVSAAVV